MVRFKLPATVLLTCAHSSQLAKSSLLNHALPKVVPCDEILLANKEVKEALEEENYGVTEW